MTDHPLTPPPKLFRQWKEMPRSLAFEAAYRAGADAELEACCEWLSNHNRRCVEPALRAARRPKPPSNKEQALSALSLIMSRQKGMFDGIPFDTIRRALEQLPE